VAKAFVRRPGEDPLLFETMSTAFFAPNRVAIPCSPEERHRWDLASRPGREILTEWARQALNEKADAILETRANRSPARPAEFTERVATVCKALKITPADFSLMACTAALEAIEDQLARTGTIPAPLAFRIAGHAGPLPAGVLEFPGAGVNGGKEEAP